MLNEGGTPTRSTFKRSTISLLGVLLLQTFAFGVLVSDSSFKVLHFESGTERDDLPIFVATQEAAEKLLDSETQQCGANHDPKQQSETTVEEVVDGVFILHNVLSSNESNRILNVSLEMGYQPDAPVNLGRNVRRNENCVWIMNNNVNRAIFERVSHLLPNPIVFEGHSLGGPLGLNRRWRLYKYSPGDFFLQHTDGAWPGSGEVDGRYIHDMYEGEALSWITFLIYLNDDFEGGGTTIYLSNGHGHEYFDEEEDESDDSEEDTGNSPPINGEEPSFVEIRPRQGSVLCFYHGYHPLSRLHQGETVLEGTKYVARTDVLYQRKQAICGH